MRPTALLLAVALTTSCAATTRPSLRFVPDRMTRYHVPGLSLALIHNGTVQTQTFGVARIGGEPVTPETLFQASSISMPVTAVAVLRLVEQGKLDLDADVRRYLRTWKLPSNRFTEAKMLTLRELLSHTAGATVHGFAGYAAGQTVPALVQVLNGESPANSAPVTVDFLPGTKFRYAGGNYTIIQQILVDATGEPFPELMQELVLGPLHMTHSTFQQPIPEKLRPLIALPYDEAGNPIEGGPHTYPEMAVAGLWTTPSDLALFALAIQDALIGKPTAVLSRSTVQRMLQPVLGFYGLGFAMAGKGGNRYFSHPGVNAGFVAFLFAYEKGDGLILMTNGQNTKSLGLEIISALSKEYDWTEFPTESPFSKPWMMGLVCACTALLTHLLFRAIRHRKRPKEQPAAAHL